MFHFLDMATGIPIALANTMKSSSNEKPFTYLPGGLDFSEIRIPGLAKRIGKQQQQQGLSRTSVAAEDIQNQVNTFFTIPSLSLYIYTQACTNPEGNHLGEELI